MTVDLDKIWASKAAYRKKQAALPFAEKLQILDKMRERQSVLAAVREKLKADKSR